MKRLWSKWGAGLFLLYLAAGALALSYEAGHRAGCWMMCDLYSGLLSLPAALPVRLLFALAGCRDCTLDEYRVPLIFASGAMLYLSAAFVEARVRRR